LGGRATVIRILAVLIPTNIVVEGIKAVVGRVRPDGDRRRVNSSFPSGHSANAFALALVLARRSRRPRLLFWPVAALVAISRAYLNRHYLSDIVVGSLIGLAVAWAVG